jgi:hypothetical protein
MKKVKSEVCKRYTIVPWSVQIAYSAFGVVVVFRTVVRSLFSNVGNIVDNGMPTDIYAGIFAIAGWPFEIK